MPERVMMKGNEAVVEAAIARHQVGRLRTPAFVREVADGVVGHVGELREIGVQAAVEERRLGARAAGVFPLGLGRQRDAQARLLAQPAREGHRLVPRHADRGLPGPVQPPAQVLLAELP